MTREQIIRLLKVLSDNYNIKIADPKGKVTAWEMELGNYSAESIYKAARLHMQTSQYFPSPADLINKMVRAQLLYMLLKNILQLRTKLLICISMLSVGG